MGTITLMDVKRQALEFQKKYYYRPTGVYVSPDVSRGLCECVSEWMHDEGLVSPFPQPAVGLHSIHGMCIDGLTYRVLLTGSKNIVAFSIDGNRCTTAVTHSLLENAILTDETPKQINTQEPPTPDLEVSDVPPETK